MHSPQSPSHPTATQDPRQRLAALEEARLALIREYQSRFATLQRQWRARVLQSPLTVPATAGATASLPSLPPLPAFAPPSARSPILPLATHPTLRVSAVGWIASALIVTWTVLTPQYIFSTIPHVPLYPLLLTVGLGLLMFLASLPSHRPVALPTSGVVGMLYALMVGGPFLAAWVLCAWSGVSPWPTAVAGLLGPSLLLLYTSRRRSHRRLRDTQYGPRPPCLALSALAVLASLFYGYGSLILAGFLVTAVTQQGFGLFIVMHLSTLLLLGAALSGGLYRVLHRASTHPPCTNQVFPKLSS